MSTLKVIMNHRTEISKFSSELFNHRSALAGAGGGTWRPTPMSFSGMALEALGGSRWNFAKQLGHPFCNLAQNFDLVRSVMELWHHTSTSLRSVFHRNRIFCNVTCCHWLEWRHYLGDLSWRFRSEHDHIWPMTLHLGLSKVIRGHWPWPTPYLPIEAKLVVLGVSWGSETEYVIHF